MYFNQDLKELQADINANEQLLWMGKPYRKPFIPSFRALNYGVILAIPLALIFGLKLTSYDIVFNINIQNVIRDHMLLISIGTLTSVFFLLIGLKNWGNRCVTTYLISEKNIYFKFAYSINKVSYNDIKNLEKETNVYGDTILTTIYLSLKIPLDIEPHNLYNFNFKRNVTRIEIFGDGEEVFNMIKDRM